MRMLDPAIIHNDAASDEGVSFPDFPGGVTAAASADAFATRHGLSRSALIAEALKERLARG